MGKFHFVILIMISVVLIFSYHKQKSHGELIEEEKYYDVQVSDELIIRGVQLGTNKQVALQRFHYNQPAKNQLLSVTSIQYQEHSIAFNEELVVAMSTSTQDWQTTGGLSIGAEVTDMFALYAGHTLYHFEQNYYLKDQSSILIFSFESEILQSISLINKDYFQTYSPISYESIFSIDHVVDPDKTSMAKPDSLRHQQTSK